MKFTLPDGIPSKQGYADLLASDAFKEMEARSDRFLSSNAARLRDYMRKWVKDPLHQWSRQWEYPYVFGRLQQRSADGGPLKVLDAGSGVTFFPYLIGAEFQGLEVDCCDYDVTLASTYGQINEAAGKAVNFSAADMKDLPYDDGRFDVIYCISVLEHTDDYDRIIDQFHRVLKPGGSLIVTFDISLDGTRDIDLGRAETLLNSLTHRFVADQPIPQDLSAAAADPDIFTTLAARQINPGLLPWQAPAILYRLKSLLTSGRLGTWPPPLTVYCLTLTKDK